MDASKALVDYIQKDQIADFSAIPYSGRVNVLIPVVRENIKSRKIGSYKGDDGDWHDKMVPYIPHTFAKKAIAFMFNNRWGCEVRERSFEVIKQKYTTKDKKQAERNVYQATALVRFTFYLPGDQSPLFRDVIGTGRAYDNAATSTHEVEKMAVSNCYTLFLQSFGIIPQDIAMKDYDADDDEPAQCSDQVVDAEVVEPAKGPKYSTSDGFEPY